ncbi:MAG: hypothetical protein AW07_00853 [Candidatus Accumulibacter sp. SK-11]|nr:MAG: hypothetical protein AW07_00853 [Candidatus Accumulibacter sp. SK-11]
MILGSHLAEYVSRLLFLARGKARLGEVEGERLRQQRTLASLLQYLAQL